MCVRIVFSATLVTFKGYNKINSRFYIIPSQHFSSLRNSVNGTLDGKIGNFFLRGGGGGKEHGSGPLAPLALKVTIGVKGYQNSVQPPPLEILGSAPDAKQFFGDACLTQSKSGWYSNPTLYQSSAIGRCRP